MGSTDYEFRTMWRVAGTTTEVKDVLGEASTLPEGWPSVYLSVTPLSPGSADGIGRSVDLHTKGWLPYTLRWKLTVTEPITDKGFAISAKGDLNGTGRWTFEQDGPEVIITYDWHVSTAKPLLPRVGWLLKPLFSPNHTWAMAPGQQSLALELRRPRRASNGTRDVPPPPGPTFKWLPRGSGSGK